MTESFEVVGNMLQNSYGNIFVLFDNKYYECEIIDIID